MGSERDIPDRGPRSLSFRAGDDAASPLPELPSAIRPAQMLLSLQERAGNRAVCQAIGPGSGESASSPVVQRRVKFGASAWHAKNVGLPAVPTGLMRRYQPYVIDAARVAAERMRDDDEQNGRTYARSYDLYKPLIQQYLKGGRSIIGVVPGGGALPWTDDPWDTLWAAVKKTGSVTEVPWSSFNATAAKKLYDELAVCNVQVSSNSATTAWHGNTHQKLPKRVLVPGGHELASLPPAEQWKHTPYVEFLVPGHKNQTGIERGILDRPAGQIYITAHYDVGSLAWLVGAPSGLVDKWRRKAKQYQKDSSG